MASIHNRILNGSFESGLANWISQNVKLIHLRSNNWTLSAELCGGAVNSFLIQSFPVGPDEIFELRISIARETVGTSPVTTVTIQYYDPAHNFLGYGLIQTIDIPKDAVQHFQTVSWITASVPPGATRAQIVINRLAETGSAGVRIAQVELVEIFCADE